MGSVPPAGAGRGVSALRVSLGEQEAKSLVADFAGGIQVAVEGSTALARPHAVGKREAIVDGTTRRAEARGREEAPDRHQMLAGPPCLVDKLKAKLRPSRVVNTFGDLGSR
jgi:ammonia channel protein AmtB